MDDDAGRTRERANDALEQIYGRRIPSIEVAAVAGTAADFVRNVHAVRQPART